MINYKNWIIVLAIIITITSCKKDTSNDVVKSNQPNNENATDTSKLVRVGTSWIQGASARTVIYAEKELYVGYNKLYIAMYDSLTSKLITDGHLELLKPIMDMGTMMHSAPVEFSENVNTSTGLWEGAVVFSMPSMGMGSWALQVGFHNHSTNKEGEGDVAILVMNPSVSVFRSLIIPADDSARVFISLLQPKLPKIALNDFEITLHKKQDMMNYPAIDNYTIEIEPEMPTMGHGSPNNVSPILASNGHYKGKVNFTMTGFWRVHIKLFKNGNLLDSTQYFDITF